GSRQLQSFLVDRLDMRFVKVICPHLDVLEIREAGREERADGPAADDADPHARTTRRLSQPKAASENSRPPVRPEGRTISTSAINAPTVTRRVPVGKLSWKPTLIPDSACPRKESSPLIASAPMTAPHRLVTPPTTSIARLRKV